MFIPLKINHLHGLCTIPVNWTGRSPQNFYTAVAEILVYLYKQDNGKNKDKK